MTIPYLTEQQQQEISNFCKKEDLILRDLLDIGLTCLGIDQVYHPVTGFNYQDIEDGLVVSKILNDILIQGNPNFAERFVALILLLRPSILKSIMGEGNGAGY